MILLPSCCDYISHFIILYNFAWQNQFCDDETAYSNTYYIWLPNYYMGSVGALTLSVTIVLYWNVLITKWQFNL